MTAVSPNPENTLRQGFRYFNQLMIGMWRLGMGQLVNMAPPLIGRIMVITHRGRKTGVLRRTPVNYALVDGYVYCTAGFGSGSDWYRNIRKNPEIEVWLPDGWWAGIAEDISDSPNRLALLRQVLVASGFAAFAAGVNPYEITDAELERLTRDYRLVRITRTQARTGHGGPSEFAWIWPLATMLLLPLLFRRRR